MTPRLSIVIAPTNVFDQARAHAEAALDDALACLSEGAQRLRDATGPDAAPFLAPGVPDLCRRMAEHIEADLRTAEAIRGRTR